MPGFVAGEPAARFKASNPATQAALALEDALHQATAGTLVNTVQKVGKVHDQMHTSVKALLSHTERVRQWQEAAQQSPLSSDLSSQSLETLEKELADLNAAKRAAAEADEYDEAKALKARVRAAYRKAPSSQIQSDDHITKGLLKAF